MMQHLLDKGPSVHFEPRDCKEYGPREAEGDGLVEDREAKLMMISSFYGLYLPRNEGLNISTDINEYTSAYLLKFYNEGIMSKDRPFYKKYVEVSQTPDGSIGYRSEVNRAGCYIRGDLTYRKGAVAPSEVSLVFSTRENYTRITITEDSDGFKELLVIDLDRENGDLKSELRVPFSRRAVDSKEVYSPDFKITENCAAVRLLQLGFLLDGASYTDIASSIESVVRSFSVYIDDESFNPYEVISNCNQSVFTSILNNTALKNTSNSSS